MSDSKYLRDDYEHCLGHLIEELGECTAAAGKTARWGWASFNPELPPTKRETNILWLQREMHDVEEAIGRLRKVIEEDRLP